MEKNFWLYPLAWKYQGINRFIRWLYDSGIFKVYTPPLPVVSIGNITFGGSEKTPLAQVLLKTFSNWGYKPALISRGYRGRWEKTGGRIPPYGSSNIDWRDTGDEPFMIAQNRPEAGIFVGKNKLDSCRKAEKAGCSLAVLDDGFQHYRLKKDIDIVIHSQEGRVLKREPFSSLKKADLVLLKENIPKKQERFLQRKIAPVPVYRYSVEPLELADPVSGKPFPLEKMQSTPFIAFCGIARPQRFAGLLERTGLNPVRFLEFPDHHTYPPDSIQKIIREYRSSGAEAVLTTEKDAVKLKQLVSDPGFPLRVVKIQLRIEPDFYKDLKTILSGLMPENGK